MIDTNKNAKKENLKLLQRLFLVSRNLLGQGLPMQTDPRLLANNTQHCWAQQCCDLLRPFAWNHNNVGTCCV